MNYLIDTHTHTLASGHAYNTIMEMVGAAKEKGLEILGITEHGPKMPGACGEIYFSNLRAIDRDFFDLEVLFGVELNITGYGGELDLREDLIMEMDVTIASLHTLTIGIGSVKQNTDAVINTLKNPLVDIIGHPDDGHFPLDYKEIVLAAKEYGKVLELNNNSLNPKGFRIQTEENSREILSLCAEHGVKIVVSSDAHFVTAVGACNYADKVIEAVDFPKELILNYDKEGFRKTIQKYKKTRL